MSTSKLEITAVDVRSFKRLAEVRVETGGHRNLLLVAGKNTAGKSSLMDALTVALGGKGALPADPVRHGADKAEVSVELDGGRYTITRTITGKGRDAKTTLRVVGPDGPIGSPQTWLDSLVSGRFLDPVAFLQLDAKAQRQALLALVGVDVDAIDAERKAVYDERTTINRDAKGAQARLDAIGAPPAEPPPTRPLAEIQADGERIAARIAEAAAAKASHAMAVKQYEARLADVDRLTAERERLLAEVERVTARLGEAQAAIADGPPAEASIDTSTLEAQRANLRRENQAAIARSTWETAVASHRAQVERAAADLERLLAEAEAKTIALAAIDERKARELNAAKMPIDGLHVVDDGLWLNGVPFAQASQAERLRCALAIAMRQSPRFRDVWVRDGALLDDDGIEIVRQVAEELDCRVWLEVVGEDEPGAIVIRDGMVVGAPEAKPAKETRAAKVLTLVPPATTNTEPVVDDDGDLL